MLRRSALFALAISLVVPLTACAESTRIPEAEPSPSVAPLFASDQEALAAATAAYEEFLRVSGEILRDGGAEPERLKPLVSDDVYSNEAEGFATLVANNWRATGHSKLIGSVLQQHTPGNVDQFEVVTYACVDVTDTDVVDEDGVSQIALNRQVLLAFEVVFSAVSRSELVIERKTLWDSEAACEG